MGSSRDERLASNEAMFRIANERMANWDEQHAEEAVEPYFCECADPECRRTIPLHKQEYEAVRADSCRFFVVSGHEIPDIETLLEDHGGWLVVEKNPEVAHVVESLDPRQPD
jgi:hypothetical protein